MVLPPGFKELPLAPQKPAAPLSSSTQQPIQVSSQTGKRIRTCGKIGAMKDRLFGGAQAREPRAERGSEPKVDTAGISRFELIRVLPLDSTRVYKRAIFILELVVVLTIASSMTAMTATAAEWKGITPTRSDKADVTKKLGRPTLEMPDRMEFTTPSGKIVIFFYTQQDTVDLKLSPLLAGKVLTMYLYPRKRKTYNLKELAAKVVAVGHGVTMDGEKMASYDDGEHGISYHFKNDENRVWRIVYYAPRAEFAKYKLPDKGE